MAGRSEFGSDVIVEMMQAYGIDYACTNLGGTFRGLLDSIVNFGENRNPEIIECLHEEIAVSVAHGYARASGKPTVALVHNVVGTLHASMAIYDAYVARSPVIVMSGTGPMRLAERRPWIDWVHTALIQGNLVRDYVKWDDQPVAVDDFPESFMRAYRLAVTEPKGPIYITLDATLQEARLSEPVEIPDVAKFAPPSPVQGDLAALRRLAEMLAVAEAPVILADRVGRNPQAVKSLVELAEAGSIAVIDGGGALNFPSTHPLDATGTNILGQADLIVLMDVDHAELVLTERDRYPRGGGRPRTKPDAKVVSISLADLWIRSTTMDFGKLWPAEMTIAADTSVAIPELTSQLNKILSGDPARADKLGRRRARVGEAKAAARRRWEEQANRDAGERPISHARLAQETWNAIKGNKWVVQGNAGGWTRRLWDMERPGSVVGGAGAAALGSSLPKAVGMGLAAKKEGGFCVDFNGDGDLFYVPTSMWTAVHHHIPVLVLALDNGGYIGEGGHVRWTAEQRDRSNDNAHICVEIQRPNIDIAALARSCGAYAEGPIENPDDLGPAIERAVRVIQEQSTMAVVQVRCE